MPGETRGAFRQSRREYARHRRRLAQQAWWMASAGHDPDQRIRQVAVVADADPPGTPLADLIIFEIFTTT